MREQFIITEPFKFITILALSIHRKVNEHSSAVIKGIISESLEQDYITRGTGETQMQVLLLDEDGNKNIFFRGMVDSLVVESQGGLKTLTISLKSNTYLMDLQEHIRVFQDENITYGNLQRCICDTYQSCNFLMDMEKDVPLQYFFVQYQETDWEFLQRVAAENKICLVPADTIEGIKYYMKVPEHSKSSFCVDTEFTLIKNTGEYERKVFQDTSIIEDSELYLRFEHREFLEIGREINFHNLKFYVYEIDSNLKQNQLVHTYSCKRKDAFYDMKKRHPYLSGCSLTGVVHEVAKDKVKVELHEDEIKAKKFSRWFCYSTIYSSPDGTGWYAMPEIGDEIRLYFPSATEAEAYAISSVHLTGQAINARKNPDEKSLKTKYGKEVRFTPESLVITNNKGMSISILDEEGIRIESDKSIVISGREDIDITSTSESITLMASELVDINQGGTKLIIDDNIEFKGGKMKME